MDECDHKAQSQNQRLLSHRANTFSSLTPFPQAAPGRVCEVGLRPAEGSVSPAKAVPRLRGPEVSGCWGGWSQLASAGVPASQQHHSC